MYILIDVKTLLNVDYSLFKCNKNTMWTLNQNYSILYSF